MLMKKITLLLISFLGMVLQAQQFDSGVVTLSNTSGLAITVRIQTNASTVTLIATGPSDRWFAIGFGTQNMNSGDCLIFSSAGISDRNFIGFTTPSTDTNDWTVSSNSVAGNIRTIVGTRALTSPNPTGDYAFSNSATAIPVVWARSDSATNSLAYHGGSNRGSATVNTTLNSDLFSMQEIKLFPNPANEQLNIQLPSVISNIDYQIFDLSGKRIISGTFQNLENSIDVNSFNQGTYLLYLSHPEMGSLTKLWVKN